MCSLDVRRMVVCSCTMWTITFDAQPVPSVHAPENTCATPHVNSFINCCHHSNANIHIIARHAVNNTQVASVVSSFNLTSSYFNLSMNNMQVNNVVSSLQSTSSTDVTVNLTSSYFNLSRNDMQVNNVASSINKFNGRDWWRRHQSVNNIYSNS